MKPAKTLALLFVAAVLAMGSPAGAKRPAGQRPVMKVLAGSIGSLRVPGMMLICARGQVNSGGWTNGTLTPRVYVVRPRNGIWEVDFTATPPRPGTMVPHVVTPISAEKRWAAPARMRGVRIVGATNSIVVRYPSTNSVC
jgi:hypothetical protein